MIGKIYCDVSYPPLWIVHELCYAHPQAAVRKRVNPCSIYLRDSHDAQKSDCPAAVRYLKQLQLTVVILNIQAKNIH